MSTDLSGPSARVAEIERVAASDRSRAIDLAIAALGDGVEETSVLRLVAEGLAEDRRWQDAAALLHSATVNTPDDVDAHTEFGQMLVKLRRLEEAVAVFETALAIDAQSYRAHLGIGSAHLNLNRVALARHHYQTALAIRPEAPEALSALAVIAARTDDPSQARSLAERALSLRPDLVRAQTAIAQADLAEGAPGLARARLTWVLGRSDLDDDQRADALSFLADAFDALDQTDEAFGCYTARNALIQTLNAPAIRAAIPERRIDQARRLAGWFKDARPEPWREPAGPDRRGVIVAAGHVFLLGFARSGTTLLETALASHPSVVAMEERIVLSEAGGHFMADATGLRRLETLSSDEADAARDVYWDMVRSYHGEDMSRRVFVDKLPFHTLALPVIAKLFPRAKILFAKRDPRDIVLSCFRRHFRTNAATFELLTLPGAAEYYDLTMELAEIYRAKLPLRIHDLHNETLVGDFRGEMSRVLEFIGLDWDSAVLDFPARARELSNTPSAPQVARGINASGIGQWRRYKSHLAPILRRLEPWVVRYGYEPTPEETLPPVLDPVMTPVLRGIAAATGAGDLDRAFAEVDAAFARGLDHPQMRRLRGVRAQRDGDLRTAIADFTVAAADTPGDAAILSALGLCLARAGRHAEALERLDLAIAIGPRFAPAHYNRGWTLEALGDLTAARHAYERAAALDPRHAQAIGALAILAGRTGAWPTAREFAERAMAIDPEQPSAIIALAGAEASQGQSAVAESRLRRLIDTSRRPTAHERAVAEGALGDTLDRMDRPGEAFSAYQSAGARLKALYGVGFGGAGRETSLTVARRLAKKFARADPADWRAMPAAVSGDQAAGPVFVVGFPRSGTTLLGQVLAGHPDVVTLDERETLADTASSFLAEPEAFAKTSGAAETRLAAALAAYWDRVRTACGPTGGKTLVDKAPMNVLVLPLIARLFPGAKILFVQRDPRDVVLSALRRQFVVNPTTIELMTLHDAAGLYVAVMELLAVYRGRLELDIRIQSHEAMVSDFDAQIRAVLDFIGLPWRPGLDAVEGRAGAVATPSGAQLARGLNSEGVGHWRRYREELRPVLPLLEPWVERFGYPTD